jgi:hypothetical protein
LRTSARDAPLPINNSKLRASIGNSLICLQAIDLYDYYLFSGTHYTDHAHLVGARFFMTRFFGAHRSFFCAQDGRITESILHVSVVKSARSATLPNRVLRSD